MKMPGTKSQANQASIAYKNISKIKHIENMPMTFFQIQ